MYDNNIVLLITVKQVEVLMTKILVEGLVCDCPTCKSKLSFEMGDVQETAIPVPAGHSPEEEATVDVGFYIYCPKCKTKVCVAYLLGTDYIKERRRAVKRANGY